MSATLFSLSLSLVFLSSRFLLDYALALALVLAGIGLRLLYRWYFAVASTKAINKSTAPTDAAIPLSRSRRLLDMLVFQRPSNFRPIPIVVPPSVRPTKDIAPIAVNTPRVKQPYDALLVLDVEATCVAGCGFEYPNEIIVCSYLLHVSTRGVLPLRREVHLLPLSYILESCACF